MKLHAVSRIRLAALFGAFATFLCTLLHAAPQDGWWWNPDQSGRGFFLEVQGPRMFMSGYFYADDGSATWLVSNDPMPNENSYDGRLLAFRAGQSLLGDYRHPDPATDAGEVTLRFSDPSHGTLTWPGGSVPIERYDFHHGADPMFQPRTGWWWNPDESGRGFSIEVQGDHMFIGAYLYDDSGKPVWYVADALMQSPTHFSAPLLLFANGQTMGGPYRAPTPPTVVGTITIDFAAPDHATVTLSDDIPPTGTKKGKVIVVEPQYPRPAEKPIERWIGSMDEVSNTITGPNFLTIRAKAASVTWQIDDDIAGLDGGFPAFYSIAPGSSVVFDVQGTNPICTTSAGGSVSLTQGDLTIQRGGSYRGEAAVTVTLPTKITCTSNGQTSTTVTDLPYLFDVVFFGQMDAGGMTDSRSTTTANASISTSWSFGPVIGGQ